MKKQAIHQHVKTTVRLTSAAAGLLLTTSLTHASYAAPISSDVAATPSAHAWSELNKSHPQKGLVIKPLSLASTTAISPEPSPTPEAVHRVHLPSPLSLREAPYPAIVAAPEPEALLPRERLQHTHAPFPSPAPEAYSLNLHQQTYVGMLASELLTSLQHVNLSPISVALAGTGVTTPCQDIDGNPVPCATVSIPSPSPSPAPFPHNNSPYPSPAPNTNSPYPFPFPDPNTNSPYPFPFPDPNANSPYPFPFPDPNANSPYPFPSPDPNTNSPSPSPSPHTVSPYPHPSPGGTVSPYPSPSPHTVSPHPEGGDCFVEQGTGPRPVTDADPPCHHWVCDYSKPGRATGSGTWRLEPIPEPTIRPPKCFKWTCQKFYYTPPPRSSIIWRWGLEYLPAYCATPNPAPSPSYTPPYYCGKPPSSPPAPCHEWVCNSESNYQWMEHYDQTLCPTPSYPSPSSPYPSPCKPRTNTEPPSPSTPYKFKVWGIYVQVPWFNGDLTDDRYRDTCVTGASNISFDPQTGQPTVSSAANVGEISGAKPTGGVCTRMKSTPVVPLDITTDVKAFSYFLNYKDLYNYNDPASPSGKIRYYKGYSDRFRSATVMSGGLNYCLETMQMKDYISRRKSEFPVDVALFRRAQAYNCAAQYIGLRSIEPWFVYEQAGSPLAPLVGDPKNVAYQFCQPLIRGNGVDVLQGQIPGWPPMAPDNPAKQQNFWGMAEVFSSNSPIINENEYLASTYINRALNNTFGSPLLSEALGFGGFYIPHSNARKIGGGTYDALPDSRDPLGGGILNKLISEEQGTRLLTGINVACVMPKNIDEFWDWGADVVPIPGGTGSGDDGGGDTPPPPTPSDTNVCPVPSSPSPGPSPSKKECALYVGSPGDLIIYPQRVFKEYYCPNVESIKDATHPFSPRNDVSTFVRGTSLTTDRAYSVLTSDAPTVSSCADPDTKIIDPTKDRPKKYGYTNYNNPDHDFWGVNTDPIRAAKRKLRFPPVQCAVVPVEIMSFRAAAFDACIMQRINYNMADWILNEQKKHEKNSTGKENGAVANWKQPCATKYYETDVGGDGKSTCPLKYSIQQCCSIITKPVVPMNHLKIRTMEGIYTMNDEDRMEKRRIEGEKVTKDVLVEDNFLSLPDPLKSVAPPDAPMLDPYLITAKEIEKRRIGSATGAEPAEYQFSHWATLYEDPGDTESRYNPDDEKGVVGYHMPYMRWWDTGAAAGNTTSGGDGSSFSDRKYWKFGSFINTLGGWDTIVGVGREGRDDDEAKFTKSRSEFFSWSPPFIQGTSPREAGNIGGWDELVLHQLYTMRFHNLNCIGRYEKLFKDGDADNYVHYAAGGSFNNQKQQGYSWPIGWRGYAADETNPVYDPKAATPSTGLGSNLDYAMPGDIALFTFDGIKTPAYIENIGFPPEFEAKIKAMGPNDKFIYNEAAGQWQVRSGGVNGPVVAWAHPDRVYVSAWNYGKFTSSVGITNQWGTGPTRVIFRNRVPDTYLLGNDDTLLAAKVPLFNLSNGAVVNWQPACSDPDYTVCVLPRDIVDWKATQIYRARYDIRDCGINFGAPALSHLLSAASFAQCIAKGFDPPLAFRSGAGTAIFKGAGTGAVTHTSYCGPAWNSCMKSSGIPPVPPPWMRDGSSPPSFAPGGGNPPTPPPSKPGV
jgi:hypothetical protein